MTLLTFGRFAHDPQRILAAVYGFALVGIKLYLKVGVGIRKTRLELGIATFTYTDGRGRASFYDPQASLLHDASLAHVIGRA
jgi:hypothetical protein